MPDGTDWTRREFLGGAGASLLLTGASGAAQERGAVEELSLTELAIRLRRRTLSAVEVAGVFLDRSERANPKLNAWITISRERALAEAAALDQEAAKGRFRSALHGVPVAVKDNIDTAGLRTTVASAVFDDRVPERDAAVVERLRAAGAVVLGKTNLHEFAMGGSSATSFYGPVHNPWALDRVAGGSSGGSAAAVCAGLAPGALGTDTGGSIRIPAALCGVTGLKPTRGLVSNRGIFPLIASLDHCGPLARSAEDAALLLGAMAGYDAMDVASVPRPVEDYVATMREVPVRSLRVGVGRVPFCDHLDAEVGAAFEEAVRVLTPMVGSVREVVLPETSDLAWTAIRAAEVWAVHEPLFLRHAEMYSLQTRRVVAGTLEELNNASESPATKMAELIRAQVELERLRRTVDAAFAEVDVVVLPTMRVPARTIAYELAQEEEAKPREPEITSNSLPFNLYGVPAMTIPCGLTREGLPIGLMVAGPHWSEARVLALGWAFQQKTDWHRRRPTLA